MAPEDIEKPVASIDAADRKAHASRPPSLLTLTHRKMSLPENAATIRTARVHTSQEAYDRCTWGRFFVSGRRFGPSVAPVSVEFLGLL